MTADIATMIAHAREDADGWEASAAGLKGRQYFINVGVAHTFREMADALERQQDLLDRNFRAYLSVQGIPDDQIDAEVARRNSQPVGLTTSVASPVVPK